MSRIAVALMAASVLAICGFSEAAERKLAVVIDGWGRIINPDGDCHVSVEAAKVKISVPPTPHDFAAELKRWNAPRILRAVKGDFIAEVKVSGTFDPKSDSTIEGRKAYNGSGILLLADNDNHASLQRASFRDGDHVRHYLNFEVRRGGEVAAERFDMDIPDADCWLRLERRGEKLFAMTSPDEVNWKSYEPLQVEMPSKLKVGIEVINSASAPFECEFEGFSLFQNEHADDEADKD